MDIVAKIAIRIIDLCKEKSITINKLADLSGLTQSTIDSIVSGKSRNPQIVTLYKICEGLNISLSEFFSEDTEPNTSKIDALPSDAQKELDLFKEFLCYKYGIK